MTTTLKKVFATTETYETNFSGFYIDITTTEKFGKYFEAFLCHEDYCLKMLMFGTACGRYSYEDFLEMVENCVEHDVLIYKERFFEE